MRITVCVGVNETVGANASDEQFAVALDIVRDLQQSRRQSHVEQYVAVSVAVEQRPVYMTIRQRRPSSPTARKLESLGYRVELFVWSSV